MPQPLNKSVGESHEFPRNPRSFDSCKYLDKDITKQFILEQNWESLTGWVTYNLKKKKSHKKK